MRAPSVFGFAPEDGRAEQEEVLNNRTIGTVHWSFWLITIVALIWNALGAINFIMQMNADVVASMPDTHRAIINHRPAWATGGFAIAVFGGTFGCFLLLLKKPVSFYFFVASLVGVIVTMIHTLGLDRSALGFGLFENLMMIVMPIVVAVFLVWYAKYVQKKGWLGARG